MEKNKSSNNLRSYLKKHWFQLVLVGILVFVLMRKDFSFQINMNNPEKVQEPAFFPKDKSENKTELLTQKEPSKDAKPGILDRFGLSFIGGGTASKTESEFSEIDEKTIGAYIKRFANVAISERKKYGVPSSIILANGLFHSFAGTRNLAENGNNHFGISCSSDWNGDSRNFQNKCYRKYENAWTSFRDHSIFVTSGKYADLLQLGTTDYKSWAKYLQKNGFSEFDDLEKNLLEIIQKYELYQLDTM